LVQLWQRGGVGDDPVAIPSPCLVVLVGPSSAGKSTWAAEHFAPDEIVSSDRLRALVGHGEDDLDATDDAFAVLDAIVGHRLGRRLTTVVDTLALDPERRHHYRELATAHGVPCVAVGFDVTVEQGRARNRERARPLPADALRRQYARWREVRRELDREGFAAVLRPDPVRVVPGHVATRTDAGGPSAPTGAGPDRAMRFGLHLSAFPWTGEPAAMSTGLRDAAVAAEQAGFDSLWLMDHVRQIPQVGRDWDPMLDPYTVLGSMAAVTTSVRLGALVTPVTFRHPAQLAKVVATLDQLSAGRAVCGLGLGWYEREHRAYGWDFPPVRARYELLEDVLEVLPLLWGPGAPAFDGRRVTIPEAIGYPRPVQARVPILVGGGGERRTLPLAARHADAVNLMGPPDVVARKVGVLHQHAVAAGRDPDAIEVTHLAPTLVGRDRREVRALVDQLRPRRATAAAYAAQVHAGTIEDQVDRIDALRAAGVQHVIASLPDLGLAGAPARESIERFGSVIAAVRARRQE
jgi:F420-dependent oxidoreductase-like protein